MSSFTPEEIQEILNLYFENFAHRQYIGARYVPIFGRKDEETIEWDNTGTYEPLTIVLYQGNSYTSRQFVPVGVEITNKDYWANTGNYNAQVEQYRQEVLEFDNRITTLESDMSKLDNLSKLNRNKLAFSDAFFDAIVRKQLDSDAASAQGFCIFGDNGEYCAIASPTSGDENTNIYIFSTITNTIISKTEIDLGHANTLSCNGTTIVCVNTNNTHAVFIDVSNVNTPYKARELDLSTLLLNIRTLCWFDANSLLAVVYENKIGSFYVIDAVSGNILNSYLNCYYNAAELVNQGIACDDNNVYWCFSEPNNVLVFDKTTFTHIDTYILPSNIGYIDTSEIEQIYIHNGTYYYMFMPKNFGDKIVPCVFSYDPDNTTPILFQRMTAANNTLSVEVDNQNGSEIVKANTHYQSRSVFKYLEDALNVAPFARMIIYVNGTFNENVAVYGRNIYFVFMDNAQIEGSFYFHMSNVRLEFKTGVSFASAKASSEIVYDNQSAQFTFLYSDVAFNNMVSYDFNTHLMTYSEFIFFFQCCNVKTNNSIDLSGFCARHSYILFYRLVAPYVCIDGCDITVRNLICTTDRVAYISPICKLNTNNFAIGTNVNASSGTLTLTDSDSIIVPYMYAANICTGTGPQAKAFANTIIQNNVPDTQDQTLEIIGKDGNNALLVIEIKLVAANWTTQLNNTNNTIRGCKLKILNVRNVDGTSHAMLSKTFVYRS